MKEAKLLILMYEAMVSETWKSGRYRLQEEFSHLSIRGRETKYMLED